MSIVCKVDEFQVSQSLQRILINVGQIVVFKIQHFQIWCSDKSIGR